MEAAFTEYNQKLAGSQNDLPPYLGDGYTALKLFCGIDLQNDDTGAITGVDTGSKTKKTAENVVSDATPKTMTWPNGKTSIRGVVFHAPTQDTLSTAQQAIVKDICNRWADGALASIEQALGIKFTDATKTKDITISFGTPERKDDNYANRIFTSAIEDGKMILYVNLSNREIKDHTNGTVYNSSTGKNEVYADRNLAHELARLMTNSYNYHTFTYVPINGYGLAELVTGADDVLEEDLISLARQMHKANGLLFPLYTQCHEAHEDDSMVAAYGYMIWRYAAKYASENPSGPEIYSADGKKVTLTSSFQGEYNLDHVSTVRVVDASQTTADISLEDTLWASANENANNTYILGAGQTTLRVFCGNDTIVGFKSDKDVIMFSSGTDIANGGVTYQYDVKDVILSYSHGYTVRIKDAVGKKILLKRADNEGTWSPTVLEKTAPPLGAGFKQNSNDTVMLASASFNGTVEGSFYTQVKTFDMRGSKKSTTIKGNNKANTIYASASGSKIYGRGGNDILVGGNGKDSFYFGTADGTDTIKSFKSSKDVIRLTGSHYTAAKFKSHVKLNKTTGEVNITDGKTKVRIVNGIGQKIRVYDASGKLVYNNTLRYNAPKLNKKTHTVTLNKQYLGTMDLRTKPYASATSINASAATHNVTLYGNSKNNTLQAGKGGSTLRGFGGTNTLIGGAGKDKFYVGKGEGKAVIKNFAFTYENDMYGGDTLQLTAGTTIAGGKCTGRNLTLYFNKGKSSATIINGAGKWIRFQMPNGSTKIYEWYHDLPANTSYGAKDKSGKVTSMVTNKKFSGTLDMRLYNRQLLTIDASQSTKTVNIYGNDVLSQTIHASQGGGNIYSLSGNDKIYCNKGVDKIGFGHYYGQDTLYNTSTKDIAYLFDIVNIKNVHGKLANGVMTLSFTGRSDTLSISNWKESSSLNTLQLSNGKKYHINADGSFKKA